MSNQYYSLLQSINTLKKDVYVLQTTNQSPQNSTTRAHNDSGAQIDAGDVVYISGIDNGRPEISLASNAAVGTYDSLLGVVPYDIADGASGYVMRTGYVRDIDTSAWAAGDELYLTAGGAMTNVRPATAIYIASVVTVNATTGVIFVNPKAADGGGGSGWENITLWHTGGVTEYDFTEAGLIAANGAAVAGDIVFIPAGTITLTAVISVTAGAAWVGMGRDDTIISANGAYTPLITMGAGSVLDNMTINHTCTSSGTTRTIYSTQSCILRDLIVITTENGTPSVTRSIDIDSSEIYDCNVTVVYSHTGDVHGVYGTTAGKCYNTDVFLDMTGADDVGIDAYGFYMTGWSLKNCNSEIDMDGDEGYMTGYYVSACDVFDCYGYIDYDGYGDDGSATVFRVAGSKLYNCRAVVYGTVEDYSYGYYTTGAGTYLYECIADVTNLSENDGYVYGLYCDTSTTVVDEGSYLAKTESSEDPYDIYCDTSAKLEVSNPVATTWGGAGTINGMIINHDDFWELLGTATAWDDIRVPASTAKRIGNTDPDWEIFKNGVYALAFDKDTDQELMFAVQIPHSWKLATDIEPHVHWSPSDTDTGEVRWCLEYTIADITGTFGATTTICALDAGDGTAYKHQYVDLGSIDMSSYTADDDISIILMCRIYRDANHADDDYDADAFLLEVDFHYQIDTAGSRTETSK